jgi:putative SOS response-associated peptidase YedK
MPLVIPEAERGAWLARDTPMERISALVRPAPAGTLEARVVSARVNSARADDAELLTPA